jgi:alpha-beta hydrolase superfamily lysophospholipase
MRPLQKAGLMALSVTAPRRLAEFFLRPPVQPMRGTLTTSGRSERIEFPGGGEGLCRGWWVVPTGTDLSPDGGGTSHAVVLAHGWTSHCLRMSMFVDPLLQAGYQVLIYNARGHGDSDPSPFISQAQFAADLTAAVRYARSRAAHVAVVGHSMGAAAAIIAAADGAPVEAVVSLAPPTHPVQASVDILKADGIDGDLILHRIGAHVQAIIGRPFDSFAPERRIAEVACPVLVMHGTADEVVPVAHFHRLQQVAGPNVEMLLVEGANHDAVKTAPVTLPKVMAFLGAAFPVNRQST